MSQENTEQKQVTEGEKKARIKAYRESAKGKATIAEYRLNARNRAKHKEATDRFSSTEYGRASLICSAAKRFAAKRQLQFSLNSANVLERWKSQCGVCAVTGTPLDYRRKYQKPTIDRKDPSKGYTPDNIQIVSSSYNRFKGGLSDVEALSIIHRLSAQTSICVVCGNCLKKQLPSIQENHGVD